MINFGKYKGKSIEDIFLEYEDYGYIIWMDKIGKKVPKEILIKSKEIYQYVINEPTTNELLNG